ncbi:MAG: hypothetical protein JW966_05030 [Anaerolineae bacterium]|nr:hypothetical protein [Anaerolineae bacterium]
MMIIREPMVNVTYYYLREAPGDSPTRRQERHNAFVMDTQRILQSVAGWLSMHTPTLPPFSPWESQSPSTVHLLMQTGELQGQINASAWLFAYVLRNMLLLRVVVARAGEHEQAVWTMLDESLNPPPTTPSWLQAIHYWCGIAPRPPEDLEQNRSQPLKTSFGVLCLSRDDASHVLVYPDARTQMRANHFLSTQAPRLDWYATQAHHRLNTYETHASSSVRTQRHALDQVAQTMQDWATPGTHDHHRDAVTPLRTQLETLESAYNDVLGDLSTTEAAAQELRILATGYRLALMQSGLWDAGPNVWAARVADLEMMQTQIETDLHHIATMQRRMEILMRSVQTRVLLLQGERERLLVYLVAGLGLVITAVLIADTRPALIMVRVIAVLIMAVIVWAGWQISSRRGWS